MRISDWSSDVCSSDLQARRSCADPHRRHRHLCLDIWSCSMTQKIKAAIIGSGNIGTDLMIKMIKYPQNMELAVVVGIDAASEGLAMARERGIATTHEGLEGMRALPVYPALGIVFDATSAYAHKVHDEEIGSAHV